MLGALTDFLEDNQLAENRYFRFPNISTVVTPDQAPQKGIYLDT